MDGSFYTLQMTGISLNNPNLSCFSNQDCYYESKTAKLCRKLSSKYDSDEEEGINKGRAATARCFQEVSEMKVLFLNVWSTTPSPRSHTPFIIGS